MSESDFLGRGWQFPPVFSGAIRQVSMNSAHDNIKQSIDLVLRTARGERCLLPYFGSELRSFLFRQPDATLKDEITQSVRLTLLNDEPRITVETIDVSFKLKPATVVIHIGYLIRQTNSRHNHVFPFSLLEGTNLTVEQQGAHQR
ncbi:hypothetical protein SAMN05216563_105263 [Phytobacter palmae]|uniref:GPW/gp25 family protein n=1 Tax=Phytobacter palmae TaxID=1855371 RepID=A0ABU9V2A2_9ENTR|nr:hypothetical protein SAMN05216563_105263 [Phytobacter palmae]